jgi:dolichol-phosphate mannosyltransferase
MSDTVVAVVIPSYKSRETIVNVIESIGDEVSHVIVVDDACPEGSGDLVRREVKDPRVKVLFNGENLGVGGATVTGYKAALEAGADIIVKLDADGQMDPSRIQDLIDPIEKGEADYTKGDRLDSLNGLRQMPSIRLFGNAGLTLLTKFSTGYWNIKDPTNGFTAIHAAVLRRLPLGMISKRYFFESDMLFRLSIFRAVVQDVPMSARYGNEKSSLSVVKAFFQFPWLHLVNFHKRLFYNYFLRDVSAASVELVSGLALWWFGVIFGALSFFDAAASGQPATTGTVMIAVLPIILGFQLLLAFLSYDVSSVPTKVRRRSLDKS